MTVQLTWDDLLIQNITADDVHRWLAEWSWLVSGQVYPVFMSKFGDWFLRRPDGSTDVLDVMEGTLTTVGATPEDFDGLVNDRAWQEEHLLSWLVYELHQDGKIPAAGQCYGFAPHPAVTGRIDRRDVVILDIIVWQSICSQMLHER